MPASFVGFTYVASAGATLKQTVAVPTGTASRDVMLALVRGNARLESPAPPAGWTTLVQGTGNPFSPSIYYRVAGAEPASYDFPYAGDVSVVTYRGINVGSVVAGHGPAAKSASDPLDVIFPSLSSTSAFAMYVAWPRAETSSTGDVWPPNGMTERFDRGNNAVLDERVRSGATGTRLSRYGSSSSDQYGGYAVLLNEQNHPPDAPILLAPASQEALNRDATNRFSWQFSDPDLDDTQSKAEPQYRVVGAADWTTVTVAGPNTYGDFAAGTFAAASYEWRVRTYDAQGLVGEYSNAGFFSAASPPAGPSITAPLNGETVGTARVTLSWTATAQDAYRVWKVADSAGTVDTATVYYDSGEVVNSMARSVVLDMPVNSRYEHLQVSVKSAGLYSPRSSVRVLVSYTPPAAPLLSVVPVKTVPLAGDFTDALAVRIVNPAPTGGQPSVSYLNLRRRIVGASGDLRVAASRPAGVFTDHRVAKGVDYEYQAEAVAANGTVSRSEWVGDFRDLGSTVEGDFADADYTTSDYH